MPADEAVPATGGESGPTLLTRAPSARRDLLVIAVASGLVALALTSLWPADVHWSPDSDAKLIQTRSIRWQGGLHVDMPYPGAVFDPEHRHYPMSPAFFDVHHGRVRSAWPVSFAAASAVMLRALGPRGLFVLPAVCGAIAVYTAGRLAEMLRAGTGRLAALLTGLASPVLVYSALFWEHTAALALGLGGVALIAGGPRGSRRGLLIGGALLGLSAAGVRGEVYLLLAAVGAAVWLCERGRGRLWASALVMAGSAAGVAPAALLTHAINGTWVPSNGAKNAPAPSLAYVAEVGLHIVPHFTVGNAVVASLSSLFCAAGALVVGAYYWARREVRATLIGVGLAIFSVAASLILVDAARRGLSTFHGFLAMSPFALFAFLVPLEPATREQQEQASGHRFVLATTVLYLLLNMGAIAVTFPRGFADDNNREWGPRYWLAVFPLVAVLASVHATALWNAVGTRWARAGVATATAALVLVAISFEALGVAEIRRESTVKGAVSEAFRTHLANVEARTLLVVDCWWLPPLAGDAFRERPMFFVDYLFPDRFDAWTARASERGVDTFVLVSLEPAERHPFLKVPAEQRNGYDATASTQRGPLSFITLRRTAGEGSSTR